MSQKQEPGEKVVPMVSVDGASGARKELPVEMIAPDPDQPRRTFEPDALAALAATIREHGLIQPIVVRRMQTPVGNTTVPWRIIAGERRWRAARMIGMMTIDVVIRAATERDVAAIGLIENTSREDLNPLEVAHHIRKLQREFGYSQSEIATLIGKDRTRVSKLAALLDLPEILHPHLAQGTLTPGHAEVLLRSTEGEDVQVELGNRAAAEGWSVRQLADGLAIRRARSARGAPGHGPARKASPDVLRLQSRLSEQLCTKVTIKNAAKGKKGNLVIHYANPEVLQGILSRIGYQED